jgi:hypothetical protein
LSIRVYCLENEMSLQAEAEQAYREAIRRIGQRWKKLPVARRVSEELATIRSEELIETLIDFAAAERERCAQIVDSYRVAHPRDQGLASALSEITDHIRSCRYHDEAAL